jgi:hypothetical protein
VLRAGVAAELQSGRKKKEVKAELAPTGSGDVEAPMRPFGARVPTRF